MQENDNIEENVNNESKENSIEKDKPKIVEDPITVDGSIDTSSLNNIPESEDESEFIEVDDFSEYFNPSYQVSLEIKSQNHPKCFTGWWKLCGFEKQEKQK